MDLTQSPSPVSMTGGAVVHKDADPLHDGYRYNGDASQIDSNYLQTGEPTLVAAEAYATSRGLHRPTIIDPADGPCEICAAHHDGVCDRCQASKLYSEVTDHTRWVGDNGFQSVKPSHFHLAPVLGVAGREAHFDELCIECYRKDYTAVYSTKPPL